MTELFASDADIVRIRDGEVCAQIRFGTKAVAPGPLVLTSGVSQVEVVVTFARVVALMQITTQQMRRAGYADNAAFRDAWRIYGSVADGRMMTVIDFELPPDPPDPRLANSGT